MKKLKIVFILLISSIVFLFSNKVNAAAITFLEIEPISQKKIFLLNIKAKGLGTVSIQILDDKKHVIFFEELESVITFEKKFNLESLKKGDYTLQIEDDLKITTQPLKVNSKEIEMDSKIMKTIQKPYVKLDTRKKVLDINWVMSERGNYKMILEGENNKYIFKDGSKDKRVIHRRYNITDLPKGNYFLLIKNEKESYSKKIRIK